MYNIIILLQIISVVLIFALVLSKDKKAMIRIGLPVLAFLVISSLYYSVPRGLKEFSDIKDMNDDYSLSMEIDRSNIDYILLDDDASLIFNHLSALEYVPDRINSYQLKRDVAIFSINEDFHNRKYTMIVYLSNGQGILMSTENNRGYKFTASEDFISTIRTIETKYSLINDDFELDYDLVKTDDDDQVYYTYTFSEDKDYTVDNVYLYKAHLDGYGYTSFFNDKTSVSFNLPKESDDRLIDLIVRGERHNKPFEKKIRLK